MCNDILNICCNVIFVGCDLKYIFKCDCVKNILL